LYTKGVKILLKNIFMNSKITKTFSVFACLLLISAIGFGTVYGYGDSSRGGSSRRTASVSGSSVGQVLGESTFVFTINLAQGMTSEEVRELQEQLRAAGFFTFPTSTGYFGPITLEAVRAFQAANGIPTTGFVGPLTRAELNS
jgi:peptidoglycan hydrolase-like protein with peptidoglycan-binding domain